MDERTVARIAACSLSHVVASQTALAMEAAREASHEESRKAPHEAAPPPVFPVLVVEDDVSFAPLLSQPGGRTAVAEALDAADAAGAGAVEWGDGGDEPQGCAGCAPWGILQLGYLLPSVRVAADGLTAAGGGGSSNGTAGAGAGLAGEGGGPGGPVRRRDACSADFQVVGIQAYLLSEAGARAVVNRHAPPLPIPVSGGESTLKQQQQQQQQRQGQVSSSMLRRSLSRRGEFDLRPAVNFAADYLLFNALGREVTTHTISPHTAQGHGKRDDEG